MAGENPTLTLTVNLETSGVNAGVAQATASVKGIAAEADKTASKFTNLKTVMLGTFASSALQKGFKDLEGFLKESVAVAEEAQTSIVELGTAMNNAKINTEANRGAVDRVTESMMKLGFTGNSTREALTKLVTATGSMTQAQKMMGVAADYARLKHMDLNEAATILSRGTVGAVRAFREYGITLDSTLPKNEAIAKAFEQLNSKIGGQAAAYAETYAGKLAILGVQTNDLKEKIGTLLLPVLTKLSGWFIASMDWLTKHKTAMEAVAAVIGGVVTVVVINLTRQLALMAAEWIVANAGVLLVVAGLAAVAAGFVYAWNKSETFRHGVVTGIEAILDIVAFLVRAIGVVAEAFLQVVTGPMRLMLTALGFFVPAAKTAATEIGKMPKAVGDFFDGAATKIEGFKKTVEKVKDTKINIALPDFAKMLATAGGAAGADPGIVGQVPGGSIDAKAAAAAKKRADDLAKALGDMAQLHKDYDAALLDRQDKMIAASQAQDDRNTAAWESFNNAKDDITRRHDEAYAAAQQSFDDATAAAQESHDQKMEQINADYAQKKIDLLDNYNAKVKDLQQQSADKSVQIEQSAVDKRQSIIQQSIDLLTNAWASATKIDIGSLFTKGSESTLLSTTTVGGIVTSVYGAVKGTADGLKAALKDKLKEIQQLQQDAGKLAAAGYSQSFIQEVLAQGPQVGDQMAQSLLSASSDTQASIQSLYGQIQTTSETGLDTLATQMNSGAKLATQNLMDQYAQVNVTLEQELAKNSADLQTSLAKENASYQAALESAADAQNKAAAAADLSLNKALATAQLRLTEAQAKADQTQKDAMATAQRTLDASLLSAQDSYDKAIKAISDSTDKQLTALMTKIEDTATKIRLLGGTVSGLGATSFAGSSTMGDYLAGVGSTGSAQYPTSTTGNNPGVISNSDKKVVINAPIAVDGSTAPTDIQAALVSMAKYGLVAI